MSRLHAVLPTVAKRAVWNMKYGFLGYPHWTAPAETVDYLLSNVSVCDSILELGCGRGSLLRGLRDAGWEGFYCGIDISERAIKDARRYSDQRSAWVISDIESFSSPYNWSAIVMIESMYYVNLDALPAVLKRISGMLTASGFLMLRLHDHNKHREYIKAVCRLFPRAKTIEPNTLCIPASKEPLTQSQKALLVTPSNEQAS